MNNLKSMAGFVFILFTSLFFAACSDDDSEGKNIIDSKDYVLTIASHKVPGVVSECGNNVLTEVYAVKKDHSDTWIQQSWIDGFEYENGYEYKIKVRETSYLDYNRSEPAWTEYKMTELISKEKKASEGIPDNFIPKWYKPQE
jgi:hypothetical protein